MKSLRSVRFFQIPFAAIVVIFQPFGPAASVLANLRYTAYIFAKFLIRYEFIRWKIVRTRIAFVHDFLFEIKPRFFAKERVESVEIYLG